MNTTTRPYLVDTITGIHGCNAWRPAPSDKHGLRKACCHGFTHSFALARSGQTLASASGSRS